MKDIFSFFVIVATSVTLFVLCGMFIIFVCDKIKTLRKRYQYQHRFDKLPTAECYCKDCLYYNNKDFCYYFNINTDDNGFCWCLLPRE